MQKLFGTGPNRCRKNQIAVRDYGGVAMQLIRVNPFYINYLQNLCKLFLRLSAVS